MFKNAVPIAIYIVAAVFCVLAISGRGKWALLFVVATAPLRNVVNRLFEFPFGKDVIDIMIIAIILGWSITALANRQKAFEKSPLIVLAMVVIFYTYCSLWRGNFYLNYFVPFDFSDPRVQDWKNYCLLPVIFLLTLTIVRNKKWVERMILVMCLSMALVNYYTLNQMSWFSGLESREKLNGTFVYLGPNEVAAFYNQYTVLLFSLYLFMKRNIPKILLLILICVNIYCIIFLFSRGAYLGLVIGLFFLFAVRRKILLIPLLMIVIFWQTALPDQVKARIEMTYDTYGQLEESAESRIIIWQQSVNFIKENPIIGIGFGVFRDLGFQLKDTHNIYVKILTEQGLIGLVLFMIFIFMLFTEGMKLYKRNNDELSRGLGLGFVMCILVMLVNNMFGDRWSYWELSCYFWVFAGLVVRLNLIREEAYKEKVGIQKKGRMKGVLRK